MRKKLLIVGAGGHGKCCLDIARECEQYEVIDFLDDNAEGLILNEANVVGKCEELEKFTESYQEVFVAIGNNEIRRKMMEKAETLGYEAATLISKKSVISPYAEIQKGSVVFPGSIVEANSSVGKGCILAANTIVNHDARIADYVLVNSGSIIRPNTTVGEYSKVGCRCVITFGTEVLPKSEIIDGEVF